MLEFIGLGVIFSLVALAPTRWFESFRFHLKLPKGKIQRGEELLRWMSLYRPGGMYAHQQKRQVLPQYSWYSVLVEDLIEMAFTVGAGQKESWEQLRIGLRQDIKFEKKICQQAQEGSTQIIVMMLIVWGVFLYMDNLGLKLDPLLGGLVMAYQLLGAAAFFVGFKELQKRKLRDLSKLISILLKFFSYSQAGLPVGRVIQKSSAQDLKFLEDTSLSGVVYRVDRCIEDWKLQGQSTQKTLEESLIDTWFIAEQKQEKLGTWLKGLVMVYGAVFVIPSFFVLILGPIVSQTFSL